MNQDEIYQVIEQQARLKCGNLWDLMNINEQNTVMLKISIVMLKDCFNGDENDNR